MTRKTQNPFTGRWRITWMSDWYQDYVDIDGPGHVTFTAGRSGSFQFGMVQGRMHCKFDLQQSPQVEFTWHGFDEGDEIDGRGRAAIVDGELRGHIFIHLGDDSAFRATRQSAPPRKPRRAA